MLLKILGGMLVLTGTAAIGLIFSRNFEKRPMELKNLQILLQMFENEILFMSNVVTRAFYNISDRYNNDSANIFKDAADFLKNTIYTDAKAAWEHAVRKNARIICLTKEDEDILIVFGKMLGSTDSEGQIKSIRLAINHLKIQEEKAEELKKKNLHMCRSLGVLGGLLLIIVLF